MMNKLKVIVTGATGMVGEGVLYECLQHTDIEKVVAITRKPTGYKHPKLTEIIHSDFSDIAALEHQIQGYNACYFCLGVTSIGKDEAEYEKFTYRLTIHFATQLAHFNPEMTFCYVSGAGTDSSEQGKIMWARVKGRTENDLMKLPFKGVYNFRPAGIEPFLPLKPTQTYYKTLRYFGWILKVVKFFAPNYVVSLEDLAMAMIHVSTAGYSQQVLEVKDIKLAAKMTV